MVDFAPMERDSDIAGRLRQHHLFSGLQDETFDGLLAQMTTRTLQSGEVLFHRGDEADSFYYLHSGQLSLAFISATGEKKIIEVARPGMTIAEAVAFMQETRYPVTAEALSLCAVVRIPHRDYIAMLHESPAACLRLLADVSRHLHARVRDIETLTIQNARHRCASYLLDQVGQTDGDTAVIQLSLPKNVIASRLSVKPETLSRILRSLSDEGIISIDDKSVKIHSLASLRPYD